MTERQLMVAIIAGGTLLALIIITVMFAALGFWPVHPVTNVQLPTI